MAVLLGPAGVGLIGVFISITGLLEQVTGKGISSSGVRQIAEASVSGNEKKIAIAVLTLRRIVLFAGIAGMLVLLVFRNPISRITFGNTEYAGALGLLSVAILMAAVSSGQHALVQGMRRISDLARLNIFGAFFGVLFSVPMVYFW